MTEHSSATGELQASESDPEPRRRRPQPVVIGVGVVATIGAILVATILARPMLDGVAGAPSDSPAISSSVTSASAPASATRESTPEPASPTPVVTPNPTATPAPSGAAPMAWAAGTPPDGEVNDIAWIGDRWLAVGSTPFGDNRPRAASWTSIDGAQWDPGAVIAPDPVPGPDGMSFFMDKVLVLPDEIIAFGWNHLGCCDGGKAAMWRSTDGVTWTFVDTAGTDYGDTYHRVAGSAVAPTGEFVAVSWVGLGTGSTTFTSVDGVTWTEQPIGADDTSFAAVAASDQRLLAIGQRSFAGEPNDVVWTSVDGHSWVAGTPPPRSMALNDVTWDATVGRFIVVGTTADGEPAAWLTEDGTGWSTTVLADAGFAASVSAADGLIVASGFIGTSNESLIAWSSFDGVTWQVQPLEAPAGHGLVVATAHEEAVLHLSGDGPEPEYASFWRVWAGELAR